MMLNTQTAGNNWHKIVGGNLCPIHQNPKIHIQCYPMISILENHRKLKVEVWTDYIPKAIIPELFVISNTWETMPNIQ